MAKRRTLFIAALLAGSASGLAIAELTVESYVELTIERLELAEQTWREQGKAPTQAERQALFSKYDTDQTEYLCYAGKHKTRVERHLQANPDLKERVEDLSTSIRAYVEEANGDQ